MDVSDASYYISIEKRKNKGSQMGHTKKYLKNDLKDQICKYKIVAKCLILFLVDSCVGNLARTRR
jgi:hypothetical protein